MQVFYCYSEFFISQRAFIFEFIHLMIEVSDQTAKRSEGEGGVGAEFVKVFDVMDGV